MFFKEINIHVQDIFTKFCFWSTIWKPNFVFSYLKYGKIWLVIQSWLKSYPKRVELIYKMEKKGILCFRVRTTKYSTKFQTHVKCYYLEKKFQLKLFILISLLGSWGGCWSLSQLQMGEGGYVPQGHMQAFWGVDTLLKGTSVVHWRCPGCSSCYKNSFHVLSAFGFELLALWTAPGCSQFH